jgi:hypothetical protein
MRVVSVLLGLVILIFLFPLVFSSSFTSNPEIIIPLGINITTIDNLTCSFIATGTGNLYANITWYVNDVNWNYNDLYDVLLNSNEEFNTSISSDNTSRGQKWNCQVSITDDTNTTIKNSSQITIQNSIPQIDTFVQTIEIYEDQTFSLNLSAHDSDNDLIYWSPYNSGPYKLQNTPTFETETSTTSNIMYILVTNSDLLSSWQITQKRTGLIIEDTYLGADIAIINITIIPVNDAPIFTNLPKQIDCSEGQPCYFVVNASDEEDDLLLFETNSTLFNISNFTSTSVYFNFTPTHQISNKTFNISFLVKDVPPANHSQKSSTSYLELRILDVDNAPQFVNWTNVSGIQNQTSFFNFNITAYDEDEDLMEITMDNDCSLPSSMWNLTKITDGSLGTNATSIINIDFSNTLDNFTSNDFVVCRNVTFTVTSKSKSDTLNILFNITNTNDEPYISEKSNFSQTIDPANKANISNLIAAIGTRLIYKVNVTDPDLLTYEGENFTFEVLNHTNLFFINETTGILTTNIINNITYNQPSYNITIKVYDDGDTNSGLNQLTNTRIATIHIVNNTVPTIHPINNSNCIEGNQCLKYFIADDNDVGENLTKPTIDCSYKNPLNDSSWNYSSCNFTTFFVNDNETTTVWIWDFIPENDEVGQYRANLTFTDSRGASDTEYFEFNITNNNTLPWLDNDGDEITTENISFGIIVINKQYTKMIYAFDDDLFYDLDNLTFNVNITGTNFSGTITILKTSETSALLQIYSSSSDIGNHTANISVTDTGNLTDWQLVDFIIYDRTPPPVVEQIKPYDDNGTLKINYLSIPSSQKNETIYFSENTNIDFGVILNVPLNHTFYWYYDDEYISNSTSNQKSFYFDYVSRGIHNVTVEIEDKFFSKSNFTWISVIEDLNQNVTFVNDLLNLTSDYDREIDGEVVWQDFFTMSDINKMVFFDPDDDLDNSGTIETYEETDLIFETYDSYCENAAEFTFDGKDLTIKPLIEGRCLTKFKATDPFNTSVISNQIEIELYNPKEESQTTRVVTRTEVQTRQIEVEVPEPDEFKLIHVQTTALYENGTVVVPITLHNQWKKTIYEIKLSANASEDGLIFKFDENDILAMEKDEKRNLTLTIENYRLEAPLQINVSAYIKSIDYTDSSIIYVNALESSGLTSSKSLQTRISFARDLLSDNSECEELTEVLERAEKEIGNDNYKALELINSAIAGCKYLINNKNESKINMPKSILGRTVQYLDDYVDLQLFGTIFIIISILATIIGTISHFKLKKI